MRFKNYLTEGYLVYGHNRKEYLTKFDFEGKKQKGWSKDKKKAMVFPDKGSAEKALDMTLTKKFGSVVKEGLDESRLTPQIMDKFAKSHQKGIGKAIVNIEHPEWGEFIVLKKYDKGIWEIRSKRGERTLSQSELKFWKAK